MEKEIIALAHRICKQSFMDYPDYDPNMELSLADAMTIIVMENVGHDEDIESDKLYDFFSQKLA